MINMMTNETKLDLKYLPLLRNRIDLKNIPFTDRGSRLIVMEREDGLNIRLVERWFKVDQRLSGYRERPPIIESLVFTDADGKPIAFELESYPHRLNFYSSLGSFSMVFSDMETLFITLPETACGLSFIAHVDQFQMDRRGGILRVTGDIRRNIAYTTNRPILKNVITTTPQGNLKIELGLAAGPRSGLLLNVTPRLGFNRYIPAVDETLDAAAARWEEWYRDVPSVDPKLQVQYYYAWTVMRAGLISTRFYTTREAMTPSKIHYVGVWQWDAYFHALAYQHINKWLARDQIRVVLDHQRPDGMIPDAVHDEGTITHLTIPVDADVTKPPLLAWTAWKLYEKDGDKEFLDEIYEPITHWNQWWFDHSDPDNNGLCEYLHPFSSGLDDSPIWDSGMPVTSPDLNTYLYLQMENLSRIAGVLGLKSQAKEWQERADALVQRMMDLLWDPEAGLFWPVHDGKPIKIKTPISLLPLATGKLNPKVAQRLVDHLLDPKTFWTRYPIPSVAIDEPTYDAVQMWRGPTWININYLMMEGLERSGYPEIAAELRQRSLELLDKSLDIYEYYNPETGEPCTRAATVFGWSAALFIDLALQAKQRNQT